MSKPASVSNATPAAPVPDDPVSSAILDFARAHGVDVGADLAASDEATISEDIEAISALVHNIPTSSPHDLPKTTPARSGARWR